LSRARTSAACCDRQLFNIPITSQPYTSRVGFGSKLYDGIDKNFFIERVLAMGMDSPLKPLPHQNFEERFEKTKTINRSFTWKIFQVRTYMLLRNSALVHAPRPFQTEGKPVPVKEKFVVG